MTPDFKPAIPTIFDVQTAPPVSKAVKEGRTALDAKPEAKKGSARAPVPRPTKKEHAAVVMDRKAGRVTARDALIDVQYKRLTEAAPKILKRLIDGALDVADPYHERCLDLVAKRIMPLAFWEGLGKQEFRTEDEGGARPVFVVNVGVAHVPESVTIVPKTSPPAIDVEARERESEE